MKTERRESLENINVTAEPMVPWRRPPSCREVSNTRTGGEYRGSGDGMSAKEQVVNTGNPIRWEERSQPEFREEQTGPNRVAERSVVCAGQYSVREGLSPSEVLMRDNYPKTGVRSWLALVVRGITREGRVSTVRWNPEGMRRRIGP